ncbi:hypothetical protein [Lysobacter sp. Root494]|uniref:HvfA family oxazolone/thioamide-modified RiPP metallophore n=1 Tax=Lysobacter sp. Root494 TaxID=1736549 RepID=UPI0006F8CF41|nr:hypothetical protein [Lysobacter sp. Root494]KQY52009.1 hypothetical protein ASD14_04910 [Lysobacter sp. Root494]
MSKQINKPLALAVGAALVGGIALSASAFAMTDLSSGYMVAASQAPGEAGKKDAEGKCGEGKCGIEVMDTDKDGKVSSAEFAAKHDGDTTMFAAHDANKDGFVTADEVKAHKEGSCGGDKKAGAEGKCGGEKAADKKEDKKADMEGKCGEGKCGGMA